MAKFKVGDRVKVNEIGLKNWIRLRTHNVDFGTIIVYIDDTKLGVKFDKNFGGHDCNGEVEDGHGWWLYEDELDFVGRVPKEEPTPTPVVNVNVTVNLYENACWYCRKGGVVDIYLDGAMGICPSCGRVCNNIIPTARK